MTINEREDLQKLKYKLMRRFLKRAKGLKRIKNQDTGDAIKNPLKTAILQKNIDDAIETMKIIKLEFENYLGF